MVQRRKYSAGTCVAKAVATYIACAILLAIVSIPVPGIASSAGVSKFVQADARELQAGDYLWDPSIAPSGAMNMVVDLRSQRAFVYREGLLVGISTISSGKPGYETPVGTYTVIEKQKMHHSNKYDDAPMPYMQRLSMDGLALHAGRVRRFPASHGCVRLPAGFAAALFKEKTRGMEVVITGRAPSKEDTLVASRENAPAESTGLNKSSDVQATEFRSGQGDSNAAAEAPCCQTIRGAAEANDQTDGDANNSDAKRPADDLQREDSNGNDQRQEPGQDLPPPS